jgi:hypothetical protein
LMRKAQDAVVQIGWIGAALPPWDFSVRRSVAQLILSWSRTSLCFANDRCGRRDEVKRRPLPRGSFV